jgi:hypothetical protein
VVVAVKPQQPSQLAVQVLLKEMEATAEVAAAAAAAAAASIQLL